MTGGTASGVTSGMAAVTARVAQLQALLGIQPAGTLGGAGTGGSTSAGGFADALSEALGTSAPGAATAGSADIGRQAVSVARGYTGVPYLWGGTNPEKGLDCSGLTQLVYRQLGVDLPRVAADQARQGTAVSSLAEARPGDLVFFGSPAHHVGIFAGDGTMIDAPRAGRTVGVHDIAGYGSVSAIRRMSGPGAAVSAAGPGTVAGGRTVLDLAAAQLLSASGLAGLTGASASSSASGSASGGSGLGGPYASLFTGAGRRYGLDPALLSAVAKTESGYDAGAVSPAGARGLMQLMPGTARSLGVDPDDPAQAVDGAARLLKDLLGQFGGRTDLALAGYNAGPGAVRRYGGIPPYSETRTYVQRVTRAWEDLR